MKKLVLLFSIVVSLAIASSAASQGGAGDGGFNFYCRPEINGLVAQLHPPAPYEQCSYHSHYNSRSQWTSSYGYEFGCGLSYYPCWTWEYV
jgi:hypothetical protein